MLLAGDIFFPSFPGPSAPPTTSPASSAPSLASAPPATLLELMLWASQASSSSLEPRIKGAGERETDAWSGQVDAPSADQDLGALLMGAVTRSHNAEPCALPWGLLISMSQMEFWITRSSITGGKQERVAEPTAQGHTHCTREYFPTESLLPG